MAWGAHRFSSQVQDLVRQAAGHLDSANRPALLQAAGLRLVGKVQRLRQRHEPLRQQLSRRSAALARQERLPEVVQQTLERVHQFLDAWAVHPEGAKAAPGTGSAAAAVAAAVEDDLDVASATPVTPMAPVAHEISADNCLAAGTTPDADAEAARKSRRGGRQRRGGAARKARRPTPPVPR